MPFGCNECSKPQFSYLKMRRIAIHVSLDCDEDFMRYFMESFQEILVVIMTVMMMIDPAATVYSPARVRLCLLSSLAWYIVLMRERWGQFYSNHRLCLSQSPSKCTTLFTKGAEEGMRRAEGCHSGRESTQKAWFVLPSRTKNKRNETMWIKRLRNLEL